MIHVKSIRARRIPSVGIVICRTCQRTVITPLEISVKSTTRAVPTHSGQSFVVVNDRYPLDCQIAILVVQLPEACGNLCHCHTTFGPGFDRTVAKYLSQSVAVSRSFDTGLSNWRASPIRSSIWDRSRRVRPCRDWYHAVSYGQ